MAVTTANLQCNLDSTNAASNTGSGNIWYDLSANNLDFTGTGTSRISFAGIDCFDLGSGKYFTGPDNLSTVIDWDADWTVELWINYSGSQLGSYNSPWGTGFSYSPPFASGVRIETATSTGSRAYFGYGSGSYEITTYPATTLTIPGDATTIHQLVVRKSGGTIQFLLDGVPSFSTSGITNAISLTADPFYIGYGGFYDPMVGKVAVLRVYDVALTNGEISDNFDTTYFIVNPPLFKIVSTDPASYPGTGNTWFDISGNNKDWTFATVPTYNAGYFEYVTSTSTNYELTINDIFPEFSGASPTLSLEYWIYANTAELESNEYRTLFTNDNSFNSGITQVWERPNAAGGVQGANIHYYVNATGNQYNSSTYFNPLDAWIHLVFTRSGSDYRVYVDGVQTSTSSLPSPSILLSNNTFSSIFSDGNSAGTGFDGKLAQVAGYTKALSAAEVAYLFSLGLPVPPPSSKFIDYDITNPACYPGTGSTIFDLSGNNNDLTIVGAPTYTNPAGQFNLEFNGLYASGQGAYGFGYTGLTTGNVFTKNFWFQINSVTADQWTNSLGYYYSPSFAVSEDLVVAGGNYNSAWGANVNPLTGGNLSLNQWYNVIFVADGTNQYLYVNGSLVDSDIGTQNKSLTPAEFGLCIGGYIDKYTAIPNWNSGGNLFNGKFAVYQVFDEALNGTQVTALYNAYVSRFGGGPPPTPYIGLVGGRTFGQGFAG